MNKKDYILLVEDDIDISEALESVFEMEDINFQSMKDGQSALHFLESTEQNPSLIIMDMMMPVLNGFEFRKKQLSNKKIAHIPTIAMTANCDLEKIKAGQFSDYIQKPLELDELVSKLNKYLRQ